MRTLLSLLVITVLVALAVFVADRPGTVSLVWQGWRIDTSLAVAVVAIIALATVAAGLFGLLRRLLGAPRAIMRRRRDQRLAQGYRALTRGMVAVAAGDAAEALALARKADILLAEPPLTLLLSAQAAQLNGDEQAAQRYFTAMLDRPETEFLGLRGLLMQSLRSGDEATALHLVERARALRPQTPWVTTSLFELQARAGQWSEAEATLAAAAKRKALPPEQISRHRAVLLHVRAGMAEADGRPRDALALAEQSQAMDPGFIPAALRRAALLRVADRGRPAAEVLEKAWRMQPHPALAESYRLLFAAETPLEQLKRLEKLTAGRPDDPESHLAMSRAAMAARLWGEARRHLTAAGATAPDASPRLCRAMAELEESENGDHAAANRWLAQAAASPQPDPAYCCSRCGARSSDWTPLCPACRSFDSLVWGSSTLPARFPGIALDPTSVPAITAPPLRNTA